MNIDVIEITEIEAVNSISGCQDLCQNDNQCEFWQYDIIAETCGKIDGNDFNFNKNTTTAIKSVVGMNSCKPVIPHCKFLNCSDK